MYFWLGVKNFAKIESAKIRTDGYTVLVGPNNCGKTFLMQLIYGVSSMLPKMIDENIVECLSPDNENPNKYVISNESLKTIVEKINDKLQKEKEEIVRSIFKKDIKIEELYIDAALKENNVYEIYLLGKDRGDLPDKIIGALDSYGKIFTSLETEQEQGAALFRKNINTEKYDFLFGSVIYGQRSQEHLLANSVSRLFDCDTLYLPASRNGLLLLYRDFFANRTDDVINSYKFISDKRVGDIKNYGGITQPVYEFLRFLQMYVESDDAKKIYKKELSFFDQKILEGHISVDGQGIFSYKSENEYDLVPMYVASSMINEIAPISLALTGDQEFERLIIDEVETSLHPSKQQELVRFFNRLNRKGMNLILSTHSDTFVSKLNNLYVLSNYFEQNKNEEILKKKNYSKSDLVKLEDLSVYEFIMQENEKYQIKEIDGNPQMGFQFDLFTDSVMKLYEEASQLGDAVENDAN